MTSYKEQIESLGRRLLACRRFAWLHGTLARGQSLIHAGGGDASQRIDRQGLSRFLDDAWPDPRDLGTLGCIEHALLPAAWPGCAITVMRWTSYDGKVMADVYIQDYRLPCAERFSIGMVPLADALVAALEAAP